MKRSELNIALCADANYYEPLETCMASILFHSGNSTNELNFFVVDGGLSEPQKVTLVDTLENLSQDFRCDVTVTILTLKEELFKGLPTLNGSYTTYARLLLANLIDKPWVIWVDADIICTKDLSPLYRNYQSKEAHISVLGAMDSKVRTFSYENTETQLQEKGKFNLDLNQTYINAGFILIDLALWRSQRTAASLLDWAIKFSNDLIRWNQTIVNWNLANQTAIIEDSYNVLTMASIPGNLPTKQLNYHFAGSFKPWNPGLPKWQYPDYALCHSWGRLSM